MSTNGSGPPRRLRVPRVRRPVALALGAGAALLLAGLLVAPVVLLGGSSQAGSCLPTLAFQGRGYDARPVPDAVQAVAIGVGVESGCGGPPGNVDVRSLTRVAPAAAVAVAGETGSIYVRRGLCPRSSGAALLACVRRDR